tara:strand:- start:143 stop:292 length:150 start_codon:yes stop_codon:yes gene_type:complete
MERRKGVTKVLLAKALFTRKTKNRSVTIVIEISWTKKLTTSLEKLTTTW